MNLDSGIDRPTERRKKKKKKKKRKKEGGEEESQKERKNLDGREIGSGQVAC